MTDSPDSAGKIENAWDVVSLRNARIRQLELELAEARRTAEPQDRIDPPITAQPTCPYCNASSWRSIGLRSIGEFGCGTQLDGTQSDACRISVLTLDVNRAEENASLMRRDRGIVAEERNGLLARVTAMKLEIERLTEVNSQLSRSAFLRRYCYCDFCRRELGAALDLRHEVGDMKRECDALKAKARQPNDFAEQVENLLALVPICGQVWKCGICSSVSYRHDDILNAARKDTK